MKAQNLMNIQKKNYSSQRKLTQIDINKLSFINKVGSEHSSIRFPPIDFILTQTKALKQQISLQQLKLSSHRKYQSKEVQIQRYRQIAKSNYIKSITEAATENLTRSRMQSIQSFKKRVQQHQKIQKEMETQAKKQEVKCRAIERKRINQRQKKIDKLQKLQKLKHKKQELKDRNCELQNTLKLYQGYQKFCKSVFEEGEDIQDKDPSQIANIIRKLEQNCLAQIQMKKYLIEKNESTKTNFQEANVKFEPVLESFNRKLKALQQIYVSLDDEIKSYRQKLKMLNIYRAKRGPFATLFSASQKIFNKKYIKDGGDEIGFIQSLSNIQFTLEKYVKDIKKFRKLDSTLYDRKEYDYLLGVFHPSRAASNDDKFRRI